MLTHQVARISEVTSGFAEDSFVTASVENGLAPSGRLWLVTRNALVFKPAKAPRCRTDGWRHDVCRLGSPAGCMRGLSRLARTGLPQRQSTLGSLRGHSVRWRRGGSASGASDGGDVVFLPGCLAVLERERLPGCPAVPAFSFARSSVRVLPPLVLPGQSSKTGGLFLLDPVARPRASVFREPDNPI